VVLRILSFVSDRLASVRLNGRCFKSVWQGVVGFARYMRQEAAAPRYRRRSAAG